MVYYNYAVCQLCTVFLIMQLASQILFNTFFIFQNERSHLKNLILVKLLKRLIKLRNQKLIYKLTEIAKFKDFRNMMNFTFIKYILKTSRLYKIKNLL